MFARLDAEGRIAFIPFVMLGDPNPAQCLKILDTVVAAGADAVEVGLAFSDPVADGPVIQKAAMRAIKNGNTVDSALQVVAAFRKKHPDIPVGILTYANLVYQHTLDGFYKAAAKAGVDSVLVADVPMFEAEPYCKAATAHQVAPILIAPPNLPRAMCAELASLGRGYTYVVTRKGVTGAREELQMVDEKLVNALAVAHAPRPVFGFGISTPDHVRQAKLAGAQGVISGSYLVSLIEKNLDNEVGMLLELSHAVAHMKEAT
jgi:tryptophan synthase alpha chain